MSNENNKVGKVNSLSFSSADLLKLFETAAQVFSDQAMVGSGAKDTTVKDLELTKAKANSFLDALNGVIEIQHQVEILSAQQQGFKRNDELRVLNLQRETNERWSNAIAWNLPVSKSLLIFSAQNYFCARGDLSLLFRAYDLQLSL